MRWAKYLLKRLTDNLNIPLEPSYTGAIVTSSNVRILDLEKLNGEFLLKHIIDIKQENKTPYSDKTVELINNACKQYNLNAMTICNLVTDRELFLRRVEIPEMSRDEIVDTLRFSERESVPFPINTASIETLVLPGEANKREISVLMAALDGNVVEKYHNFFRKTCFKHLGITTVPAALLALIEKSRVIDKSKPIPIISIGGTVTGVYVFMKGCLIFTRDIQIGGRNISREIATEYRVRDGKVSLNYDEAEKMKNLFGIPAGDDLLEQGTKGITGRMIREKLQDILDKMVDEIGRSIRYFKNENRIEEVPIIYLIGKDAHLKNLPEYLSETLGYNFVIYNPFEDFVGIEKKDHKDLMKNGAAMTVAIGLALDQGKRLNLLPPRYRYSFKKYVRRFVPYAAVCGFLLLVLAVYIGGIFYQKIMENESRRLQFEVAAQRVEEDAVEIIEKEIVGIKNQIKEINAKIGVLPVLNGKNISWPYLFNQIAGMLPADIALDRINVSFNNTMAYATDGSHYFQQFVIEGKVRGTSAQQVGALRRLLKNMKESGYFPHTSLIYSRQKTDEKAKTMRLFFKIASDIKEG